MNRTHLPRNTTTDEAEPCYSRVGNVREISNRAAAWLKRREQGLTPEMSKKAMARRKK